MSYHLFKVFYKKRFKSFISNNVLPIKVVTDKRTDLS